MPEHKVTRITADEAVGALTEAAWTHTPGLEDMAGDLLAAVEVALSHHVPAETANGIKVCGLCSRESGRAVRSPCPRAQEITAAFGGTLPEERTIIHCFSGGFGCDWDLHKAVELARSADDIAWITGGITMGHDLAIKKDREVYRFDVRKPDEAVA